MSVLDDFLTSEEAGKELNLTSRQMTGLCVKGELFGAVKRGGIWLIPKLSVYIYGKTKKRKQYIGRGEGEYNE